MTKKDTPQKAALREMMSNYLKENNVKVKDGTDVNSIMRDMRTMGGKKLGWLCNHTKALSVLPRTHISK